METRSPVAWALRPFQKYATFSGRAPRAELWWYMLFVTVLYIAILFLVGLTAGGIANANPARALITGSVGIGMIFILLFWLVLFVPTLAVQVRRLHDTNRSGWWLGAFWLLYFVYIVLIMGSVRAASAKSGTPPNLTGLAGAGIVGLAVIVYSIVLIVFWCKRGAPGPNRFGEDPYGANVEDVFR